MAEPKIARTVAEAEVGDLLWRLDPNANRYDANRKYLGRGVWDIVVVGEVLRQYLSAGYRDYSRETGAARGPHSGISQICGSEERRSDWWRGQNYRLAEAIKACRDRETLKTVAFALGFEGPPDFSVVPPDSTEAPASAAASTQEGEGR